MFYCWTIHPKKKPETEKHNRASYIFWEAFFFTLKHSCAFTWCKTEFFSFQEAHLCFTMKHNYTFYFLGSTTDVLHREAQRHFSLVPFHFLKAQLCVTVKHNYAFHTCASHKKNKRKMKKISRKPRKNQVKSKSQKKTRKETQDTLKKSNVLPRVRPASVIVVAVRRTTQLTQEYSRVPAGKSRDTRGLGSHCYIALTASATAPWLDEVLMGGLGSINRYFKFF